jgi:hypothetical protein
MTEEEAQQWRVAFQAALQTGKRRTINRLLRIMPAEIRAEMVRQVLAPFKADMQKRLDEIRNSQQRLEELLSEEH